MSHPSNNNRVMANEEVVVAEETALEVAGTNKARETRPSLSSNHSLRLVPPKHLLLPPRLPHLTPSSLVISPLPSSHFRLRRPHSTQASTKLYLWRGGLELPRPPKPSNALKELSVPLTLAPSRSVPLQRTMRFLWIGLVMKMM